MRESNIWIFSCTQHQKGQSESKTEKLLTGQLNNEQEIINILLTLKKTCSHPLSHFNDIITIIIMYCCDIFQRWPSYFGNLILLQLLWDHIIFEGVSIVFAATFLTRIGNTFQYNVIKQTTNHSLKHFISISS